LRSSGALITKIKSPGVRNWSAEAAPNGRKAAIISAKTAINRYDRLIKFLLEWF